MATTELTIGQFIRLKRIDKGFTQQKCATHLGLKNRSTYHRMEVGKIRWRVDELVAIAGLLEIEPGQLLNEWRRNET